jgi:hypothetical protein
VLGLDLGSLGAEARELPVAGAGAVERDVGVDGAVVAAVEPAADDLEVLLSSLFVQQLFQLLTVDGLNLHV